MKRIRYLITQGNINALRAGQYSTVKGPQIGYRPEHHRVCYLEGTPHPCSGKPEKEFFVCFCLSQDDLTNLEAGKQVEIDRHEYIKKIKNKHEDLNAEHNLIILTSK